MKKITTIILLSLTLISLGACSAKKDKATPEKSAASSSQITATSTSSQTSTSTSAPTTSSTSETVAQSVEPFIGSWELNIHGVQGWRLYIAADKFQFFPLYDGHAVPINDTNVHYELSADGKELTLVGERDRHNSLRGEALDNDRARDTLIVKLSEKEQQPVVTVTVAGETMTLEDGNQFFSQTSKTPEFAEMP